MFGLGKPRTKLGKFIDGNKDKLDQGKLAKSSGLSRDGVSRLCDGGKGVNPNETTQRKIIGALRRMGFDVGPDDFWSV